MFPEPNEIPFSINQLSFLTDYENRNASIKPPQNSLSRYINAEIFDNTRKINLLSIPNEWDDWIIPTPIYL